MMIEAIISIRGARDWFTEVGTQFPATITLINRKSDSDGREKELVKLDGTNSYEEIIESIRKRPDVCEVKFTTLEDGSAIGVVTTDNCATCAALNDTNCFLMNAVADDEWIRWRIITSDKKGLQKVVQRLRDKGLEVKLHRIKNLERRGILTEKQEEVLRTALIRGYFDYPKRISLRELAAMFNISISTASEILRKGQKKVLGEYFGMADEE